MRSRSWNTKYSCAALLFVLVAQAALAISCSSGSNDDVSQQTKIAEAVQATLASEDNEPARLDTATPMGTKNPVPTDTPQSSVRPSPTATPTTPTTTPRPTSTPTPRPTATSTPAPSPTPTALTQVISGCGGGIVSYWPWETDVKDALDQWNRIVEASNPITEAWNHFVISSNGIIEYDQAAGNQGFVEVSDNFITTAERERLTISKEIGRGEFGTWAQVLVAEIDLELEWVRFLRSAAANHSVGANQRIAIPATSGMSKTTAQRQPRRIVERNCSGP